MKIFIHTMFKFSKYKAHYYIIHVSSIIKKDQKQGAIFNNSTHIQLSCKSAYNYISNWANCENTVPLV